jgi:hypothetical protein
MKLTLGQTLHFFRQNEFAPLKFTDFGYSDIFEKQISLVKKNNLISPLFLAQNLWQN